MIIERRSAKRKSRLNASQKSDSRADKKRKDLLFVARYMPYLAVISLGVAVRQCLHLPSHDRTEPLLHLGSTVGLVVYCLSHWQKARQTLRTGKSTPALMGTMMIGILLMISGRTLADMHHHKDLELFYVFGVAVLALCVFCLGLIFWDLLGSIYKRRRTQSAGLWYRSPVDSESNR